MSLLTEPRKKTKWSLNPRGTLWTMDENKFGQKLLEKMGWQTGKGLGKNENGRTENIKVVCKNDNQGIGFDDTSYTSVAHQDDFNAILASLNQNYNMNQQNAAAEESDGNTISLEEKSKNTKNRVHYQKFVRQKDVSQYSEEDMASIFGKSVQQKNDSPRAKDVAAQRELNSDSCYNNHYGVPTFTSGSSITSYFAEKMKNIVNGSNYQSTTKSSSETNENVMAYQTNKTKKDSALESSSVQTSLIKQNGEDSTRYENIEAMDVIENHRQHLPRMNADGEQSFGGKHKKRKREVVVEELQDVNYCSSDNSVAELSQDPLQEEPNRKKKKKRKHKKNPNHQEDNQSRKDSFEMSCVQSSLSDVSEQFSKATFAEACGEELLDIPGSCNMDSQGSLSTKSLSDIEVCENEILSCDESNLRSCLKSKSSADVSKVKRQVSFSKTVFYNDGNATYSIEDYNSNANTHEESTTSIDLPDKEQVPAETDTVAAETYNSNSNLASKQELDCFQRLSLCLQKYEVAQQKIRAEQAKHYVISKNSDSWSAALKQAEKMKRYKDVLKNIKLDSVLSTTNLLNIKGYGR